MKTDKIKARIRALLNLAADDAATEAEINAAMTAANRLMLEHQIEQADAMAAEPESRAADAMAQAFAKYGGQTASTWEGVLARAVQTLVGGVGYYVTRRHVAHTGAFSRPDTRPAACFYGLEADAQLAAELFDEWRQVIAAIAAGRYGGIYRGDGAQYAYGFTCALSEQADKARRERAETVTASTSALACREGGTLQDVLSTRKQSADVWLRQACGVRLTSGGSRTGYSGSRDAYASGRADGARAGFFAQRKRALTA